MKEQAQLLLEEIQQGIRENRIILPSLPEVALRVRQLTSSENCTLDSLAHEINKDAAIAARLLKVANSAALSRGSSIRSVKQAIMNLGFSLVRSLVTQLAILQTMQSGYDSKRLQGFVASSLQISSLCHSLAIPFNHLDPELAALAGLLHDIGKLPLRNFLESQEHLDKKQCLQFEQWLHPEVGAMMMRFWNMPDELIVVAAEHENILRKAKAKVADYTDLVITANIMHYGLEAGRYAHYKDTEIPALSRCNKAVDSLNKGSSSQRMNLALALIGS